MVFSSLRFFLFLAAILALLGLPLGRRTKKILLCAGSCLFYAAWDYRYLGLLLLISGIDYVCGARIHAAAAPRSRRLWLLVSIVTNLAILGYFKYAGFFLANLNGILRLTGRELPVLHVLLPAGISFYTFKSMSYTIDVYRRVIEPVDSLLEYAMFVTLFPDLIAGPIVRASVFLPQLDRDPGPTWARLRAGGSLFLVGLGKKLLIADHCASVADVIFAAPQSWSCFDAWCGLVAYTIQIYCDFSGYSDMAIGTAKMLGYDLPENFRTPYLSRDIAEFWRRWHMTLSAWLRDYLYIPLGGNRRGPARTYVNLMLTMLLGGLWHGASWNFVLWGGLHGAALMIHRAWKIRFPRLLAWPATLLFVMLCWVPFRATSWSATVAMFEALAGLGSGRNVWLPAVLGWSLLLVIGGHVLAAARTTRVGSGWELTYVDDEISGSYVLFGMRSVRGAFLVTSIILTIYYFGAVATNPFIYFQF